MHERCSPLPVSRSTTCPGEPISRLFSDGRKRRSSEEKLDPSSAAEQQSDQQGEQVDDQELQTEDQAWRSGAGI